MIYEQDWLMRQIQMIVQFVAKLLFNKDTISYEVEEHSNFSQADILYNEIQNLIMERKICEAENLLYDRLDVNDKKYLELAIDFYQTINKFTDEELEDCNFSREEVNYGLVKVLRLYECDTLIL